MTVTVTPTLYVDGIPVALTDANGEQLVAVDELVIPWGRETLFDMPTTSTLTVTVRDTARGAPFASRRDLIGRQVFVGWNGSDGSSGTLFRGRITDASIRLRRRGGYDVELAAASREADAGNYRVPKATTWPAETMATRRGRIVAVAAAAGFAAFLTPTRADVGPLIAGAPVDTSKEFDAYVAGPVDVSERSALELMHEYMASLYPVPLVYQPDRDGFGWAGRRRYAGTARSARLVLGPAGKYVAAPVAGSPALHLDAAALATDGPIVQPFDSRMTRIEIGYLAGTTGAASIFPVAVPGVDEAAFGRRVLGVQTILNEAAAANQLGLQWADVAQREANSPRLDLVEWNTGRRPFPTGEYAAALLRTWEGPAQFFVAGSWPAALGVRPLYGSIGGEVIYSGGDWSIAMQLAAVGVESATTPLRANNAASTTGPRLVDLDESVTVADFAFIDVGVGYTAATQPA